jgi:UDP-2-acetamido-2-deoxy-ribo-hexuluronate aminotransferase
MDLLLDINVAVDICAKRPAYFQDADLALAKCRHEGGRLWLYAGSVQTLEYVTRAELKRAFMAAGQPITARQLHYHTRQVLKTFAEDKQWLAALAAEGAVFDSEDPEDEQLIRALDRFAPGTIKLLTRDPDLCDQYPERTITPAAYLAQPAPLRRLDFVDLAAQQAALRPHLERNLHRVLHHGHYILGPEVRELEARLAAYTVTQHCITVASGTEALLISLMALGIGPGDEVITTPFTFVATAEVIVLVGATPVFVDIDPATCTIDAALIEAKITPRTKAIMPVSLYGQPADMDAVNAIAARHGNLPVIEDAAQSFGATYRGRPSGNLSTLGCTSFFPSKPLGCYGDGGAIFTSDDALAQACREIRVHGQSQRYVHTRIGVGGRMDTLQCAIVLAKLDRFDQEIAQRQAVARRYHALLADRETPKTLPWPQEDRTSVFAQYTLLVQERDALQARLHQAGIPTAVHYPVPLNEQPAYAHRCCPDCTPVARRIARQVMSLPMHPDLTEADQDRIVQALG